ncbi:MAG: hypothetical protein LBP67_00675 [Bacteroidales bacterium]|nr:hypothetical protein [Bacteroidales bacterium]
MKQFYVLLFLFFFSQFSYSNDSIYRVCFYNFENLFDTYNDPNKNDDDFTPQGIRGWTSKKLQNKLNNLYKLIAALNADYPAAIVGICEVENKFVLSKLLQETPLKKLNYSFIHYESNDPRGIDVALLYMPDVFELFYHEAIPVIMFGDTISKTRDILHVVGRISNDTLHVFVCHFPSRYGGIGATVEKRNYVAGFLRSKADSILDLETNAKIIIMGDMNDNPDDASIKQFLSGNRLVNLMENLLKTSEIGTLKHAALWNFFDQIIITENLLYDNYNQIYVVNNKAYIADFDFLFIEDKKFGGKKVFRTFSGAEYLGGFGDHLPVYIELKIIN